MDINQNNSEKAIHTDVLVRNISQLYENDEHSDITLKVEEVSIPAHRLILASSSEYFNAMVYGSLKEAKQNEITLSDDTPLKPFRSILKYIYTGIMNLSGQTDENILEALILANKYGLQELEKSLANFIQNTIMSIKNVCEIYNFAKQYLRDDLKASSIQLICNHPQEFLDAGEFVSLSSHDFAEIISMDTFNIPEKEIFLGVRLWLDKNKSSTQKERNHLLRAVRLPLIEVNDLLDFVKPSYLYPDTQILDSIGEQRTQSNKRARYVKSANNNIATTENGAKVISGREWYNNPSENLFSYKSKGPTQLGSVYFGYTFPTQNNEITVDLGKTYMFNNIQFNIIQESSYYVETSIDSNTWSRVVDKSNSKHSNEQDCDFDTSIARYVRIVGTRFGERSYPPKHMLGAFQIQCFELFYKE